MCWPDSKDLHWLLARQGTSQNKLTSLCCSSENLEIFFRRSHVTLQYFHFGMPSLTKSLVRLLRFTHTYFWWILCLSFSSQLVAFSWMWRGRDRSEASPSCLWCRRKRNLSKSHFWNRNQVLQFTRTKFKTVFNRIMQLLVLAGAAAGPSLTSDPFQPRLTSSSPFMARLSFSAVKHKCVITSRTSHAHSAFIQLSYN